MTTPEPSQKKKNRTALIVLVVLAGGALLVPCVGVMAAIAIPAFIGYLTRAKTQEAETNLSAMYRSAEAYYEAEQLSPTGEVLTGCIVGSALSPNPPSASKSVTTAWGPSFDAIGFGPTDPLYFQYEIVGVGGCGHGPNETLYSFRAYGDLDGDGVTSMYELAAGTGPDGRMVRSAGVYRLDELE